MTDAVIDTPSRERYYATQQDVGSPCSSPTPSSRISDGWIVVHSYPQAEQWARDNLTRRGYDCYLPFMAVRRRDRVIRSLFHTVNVPLFPRYLFVKYPGNWTPVRYCPGVYRIVSAAGKPNLASNAAISALQAVEDVRRSLPAAKQLFPPGTPVAPIAGVFQDCPAVVLQVGADMILVSLMMFGALREVLVQADNLRLRDE